MKIVRLLPALLCLLLLYFLNNSWQIGATSLPAFGKLLDPFHGFWKNADSGERKNRELSLDGLTDAVKVEFDSMMIPHIFAKNEHDVYYTQGYIAARDRLWQMEFQVMAGAGRISEIIGNKALDYDRKQRRLGLVFAAENAAQQMEKNPIGKQILQAYTDGVNAYIKQLSYEDYPIEYKLLNYAPEPWSNIKSAQLLKNMAQTLNMSEKDLEMTNVLRLFSKDMVDILFPDWEGVSDPIVENKNTWNFSVTKPADDSLHIAFPDEAKETKDKELIETAMNGSNNFAVSGKKTKSGSPIICSDPHLTLRLPSIWYAVHIQTPDMNVMGVSLPGSPCVIIGFNDSIGWAVTNAQRDLVDYFKIKMKDNKREEYWHDGQWKKTQKKIEEIKIKGAPSFYDTVVYTHHGPILYDATFKPENEKSGYAYRWLAHDPSEELFTFYYLNKAKNHGDYMNALNHFNSPAQNFAFASVSGDIAMRIQGKYPVRTKGQGKFLLDGTTSKAEWQSFIPFEQNVMYKNPERNFVSSANQYPVDETYPYYVQANSFEAYRNRRINARLQSMSNITPQDLMNLQTDNYNLKASESLPTWLANLDSAQFNPEQKKFYDVLKKWDYQNNIESVGAMYYEAWWDKLYDLTWDEMAQSKHAMKYPTTYRTIQLINTKPDFSMFDIVRTPEKETAKDIIQQSFRKAVDSVRIWAEKNKVEEKNYNWATYKDTFIGHLLQGLPAFSYHVPHGGNHDIVNATSHDHGPSWRMVVSLEKSNIQAWAVYPGGQSGNPGSPYYNNFLDTWAQSRYFRLAFVNAAQHAIANPVYTIQLNATTK